MFLRTNPGQEHGSVNGETCKYTFDRKSTIETEKIIKDLKDNNRLASKVDSVMLQLKKRRINTENIAPTQEEKRPHAIKSQS